MIFRPIARAIVISILAHGVALAAWPAPDGLDLKLLAGSYHEIARIPNEFQKPCQSEVMTTYAVTSGGRLDVFVRCGRVNAVELEVRGVGRLSSDGDQIEVRFAAPWLSFGRRRWPNYEILAAGPEYGYVVLGDPSRTYLWILSRLPRMPDLAYAHALEVARSRGYDVSHLVRTPQE
jgi:apolipoprotein D and lipocalin family protein